MLGATKIPGKAEVGEDDMVVVVDEDVGRLDIAMDYAHGVQGLESDDQLRHESPRQNDVAPLHQVAGQITSRCVILYPKRSAPSERREDYDLLSIGRNILCLQSYPSVR